MASTLKYQPSYLLFKFICLKTINVFRLLCILTFFCILPQTSVSQSYSELDPYKKPSQYIIKYWNTESGLSTESTNDLIQSNDGYIWIGTFTGLHRFDGNKFTIFTSDNSMLPSPNVLKIAIDKKGILWLGTLHGICIYDKGQFIIPKALETVKDYSIETIYATQNNDIWFSTKSNQLYLYSNDTLLNYTSIFDVSTCTVLEIYETDDGSVYIGTDDSRLYQFRDQKITQIRFNEEINGINKIISDKSTIFIGTGKGLYTLQDGKLQKENILQNTTINSLLEDQNGVLWIGTLKGLYRYNRENHSLDSLNEEHGLPNNIIRDLIFDHQGNLWGGTYRNGFFQLSDGSISTFTKNDGLSSDIITGITQTSNGDYILGDEGGQLNVLKNGKISEFKPPIPLPKGRLKHLFKDKQDRIWISLYGGLVLLDGKNSRIYNIENGFPDNFVRITFQDYNGTIWVGTKNSGLVKFRNLDEWEIIDTDKGLSSNYIMSIAENHKKQLIVGTISGINILENAETKRQITIEKGLPSNFSFACYPTENYIWIASNDGLTGYSDDKTVVFNSENGLPFNIIYNVIGDKSGNLWMPGEKAILMVKIKDLEKWADLPKPKIQVQLFDKSYGMKNNHCIGAVQSYTDMEDNIWIPTQGGLVVINTDDLFLKKLKGNILIEEVMANNITLPNTETTVVPRNSSRISIMFTGIDYKSIDKLQFRYKLKPFDEDWVHTTTERIASYTNLSPGKYEFQVQMGINNVFSGFSASKHIIIQADWWQTLLARLIFVLFAILLGLLIYRLRVKSLTAQNKKLEDMVRSRTLELEKQKNELTLTLGDLANAQEHMLQSEKMASLGILAAGVGHEMNNPLNFIHGGLLGLDDYYKNNTCQEQGEELPLLLNAIREGIARATKIISSLNEFSHDSKEEHEKCDIHHILDNCLTMLQYKTHATISIVKKLDTHSGILWGNNGKLHQAFLNILTNAIQAIEKSGTITLTSYFKNNIFFLDIADTGTGIKPEDITKVTEPFYTTKEPGKGTGLGLAITYKIIQEHGGTLSFSSNKGKGTTASISLPIITEK